MNTEQHTSSSRPLDKANRAASQAAGKLHHQNQKADTRFIIPRTVEEEVGFFTGKG